MKRRETIEVELRSEEVQEILGAIPPWTERWGITLLFVFVVILLVGSYFFSYPDIVKAKMTLTGAVPTLPVVSRTSGRLDTLCVIDGQDVQAGQLLAVIDNSASWRDVFFLKRMLEKYGNGPESLIHIIDKCQGLSLGEIQPAYSSFLSSLFDYINNKQFASYSQRIALIEKRVDQYMEYEQSLFRQNEIAEQQYEIASSSYQRDSIMYAKGFSSAAEHEKSRTSFLNSKAALESSNSSINQLNIQIGQLEETLANLNLECEEHEAVLSQTCINCLEQLNNAINGWELTYCLFSPVEGKVCIMYYWSSYQTIMAGETAFYIIPAHEDKILGKALLPVAYSGKVRTGQRAIVHFDNYPDTEYGVVNGTVASISLAPVDNNYIIEIDFPEGLCTSYHMALPRMYEMSATADIVTDNIRLIERLIFPIKRMFNNYFVYYE